MLARSFRSLSGTLSMTALAVVLLGSPALAAWPNDPTINVPVCTASGTQQASVGVSDGAGGMIMAWEDQRNGYHLYAQRISSAGVPLWTADGVQLTSAAIGQYAPCITSDGAGGAIIAYTDYRANNGFADLYAQRIDANGNMLWTVNGVAVSTATNDQTAPSIAPDGSGGAIIAWVDNRSGTADVYARRVTAAGTATWTSNGVAICTATNIQRSVQVVTDEANGAYVAWEDFRSGTTYDIYAQRLNASGVALGAANGVTIYAGSGTQTDLDIAPDGQGGALLAWSDLRSGTQYDVYAQRLLPALTLGWSASGRVVANSAGASHSIPAVCSDGSGGAIVAYIQTGSSDYDLYAQRVSASGLIAWTSTGVAVCTVTGDQITPLIASDGSGGAVLAWGDLRSTISYDVYGQRLSSAGTALWGTNGKAVLSAVSNQFIGSVLSDGAGGALFAATDSRGTSADLYCQRVERYGQLGQPEPAITSVKDVKNDQGGFVKVSWSASYLDADPTFGIAEYRVWRSVPAALAQQQALARGMTKDADEAARDGALLVLPAAAQDYAWELAASQVADALPSYSLVVATTSDSVPGSFPRTAFMIEARSSTSLSADRWYSAPDSGYSVDNLAPAAPAPLTGQYAAGETRLHWNPNTEADLAGYRLYRGTSAAFVPSPATFVADLPDTGYADAAGAPYVYKLFAVDSHGNLSPVATLIPSGTLGVDDFAAPRAFLALASANPSRGAQTTLRFGLATSGRVSLALYDASGRRVRTLASGALEAGEHSARWDGRDDSGHEVAAGLYFAKLEAGGSARTVRVVRAN